MLINIPQVSQPSPFRDRITQQDQVLILSGMTWDDFEQLTTEEYSGYRISYFDGEIIIVSPGRNHERIAENINYLIMVYCRTILTPKKRKEKKNLSRGQIGGN